MTDNLNLSKNPRTITRWILTEQKKHPNAKGDLTIILNSITVAIKIISGCAQGAGVFHRLNKQLEDEAQQKIQNAFKSKSKKSKSKSKSDSNSNSNTEAEADTSEQKSEEVEVEAEVQVETRADSLSKIKNTIDKYAEDVLVDSVSWSGKVGMLASQRTEQAIIIENCDDPKYALLFDPLDGSQNINANVSVGSIFGIVRVSDPENISEKDLLQPGKNLVCAGYALYGDATLIVMTFGSEVNGFTLDPTIGEFVMTHKNIRIPEKGNIYSVNEGNFDQWQAPVQKYVQQCKTSSAKSAAMKLRYIGSMVADVHRTLLYGGIFMYPASKRKPNGKLGLLYEVNPLSFIVETAGGKATNGKQRVLEIEPKDIHQRSAIFLGSPSDVTALEQLCQS